MGEKRSQGRYAAVIADLEAQIVQLQNAIATLKALPDSGPVISAVASKAVVDHGHSGGGGVEIAIDEFHKLTLAQAIKKFLAMRPKKPATTVEIVDALRAGGQSGADGANFAVVVNNSLNRMSAEDGAVSKVRRGVWGLKEWYETKASGAG